ncbi:PTS sugar transporter subunit IIA [Enterococcus sp. AZ109]|uniref:PTS sugar transporter subunit IIA n=1 Tax=Enterococcus sp. AZ109 TaxID=2774634 RepID=UPI003F20645B
MFFSKYKNSLCSVANGKIIPLEAVKDDVFSSKMVGEGFAVAHHDGYVYAPIEGTVVSIFPTLHAITLKTKSGDTLLIHMGLDTVELKGEPFSLKVSEGETVAAHTLIAIMDLAQLEAAKKDATIVVVLPDSPKVKLVKVNQKVDVQDIVFKF